FGVVALPPAIEPAAVVPRPAELLPALLFAIACVGYLRKGNWRNWPFEAWLVAALLVNVGGQTLFVSFSRDSFDTLGVAAHGLKLLGYAFVLCGLVASIYEIYRQLERGTVLIRHSNTALMNEVEERKTAVRLARANEEKYRRILAAIWEGYFETDLAGNLTFVNESMVRLLGYEADELRGMNYRQYTAESSRRSVFEAFNRVYRNGEPVDVFGWTVLQRDGEPRFVEASACPIRGPDDEIVGFRGILRDVTARRRAEERLEERTRALARSNEELRQFAHVASHDLREPLRMVAGYTTLLARRYEGQLDEEAHLFIRYVLEGVSRMEALIRSLLGYSRLRTHARPFEAVSAQEALAWAIASLETAIDEADALVTHDPLPPVCADPTQLGQLFQNLLANAIKFRGHARLRVHVSAERRGPEWIFRVRDNGIGIDPEDGGRIFEIFQRLHGGDEYDGTGIGLAICKRIVERHGGEIWMRSTPGNGASFYFSLPAWTDVEVASEGAAHAVGAAAAGNGAAGVDGALLP
ncbi:MAG: sensor histidine kinase, partial [Gemmatimonadota bacterium]